MTKTFVFLRYLEIGIPFIFSSFLNPSHPQSLKTSCTNTFDCELILVILKVLFFNPLSFNDERVSLNLELAIASKQTIAWIEFIISLFVSQ